MGRLTKVSIWHSLLKAMGHPAEIERRVTGVVLLEATPEEEAEPPVDGVHDAPGTGTGLSDLHEEEGGEERRKEERRKGGEDTEESEDKITRALDDIDPLQRPLSSDTHVIHVSTSPTPLFTDRLAL